MTPAPRFWPLAALILLPVLVLAGGAAYGLRVFVERRLVEERGQLESVTLSAAAGAMERELDGLFQEEREVVEFPATPVPQAPDAATVARENLLAGKDTEALEQVRDGSGPQRLTLAGLPLRPLAAWQVWQSRRTEPDAMALAERLLAEPSALSSRMLESVAGDFAAAPAWLAAARRDWAKLEARQGVSLALPAPDPLTQNADGSDTGVFLDRTNREWVYLREKSGAVKLVESAAARSALTQALAPVAGSLPAWAALSYGSAGDALPSHRVYRVYRAGPFWPVLETDTVVQRQEWAGFLRWGYANLGVVVLTAGTGLWFLRRTLRKERRLGELKSHFVSSVSHELRAPIGSLRLMADGLASGKVTGAAADEFHRLMAGEGARLSSLIENVLDFARIEQGRKQYVCAETDVAALVEYAVKLMTPQAEARGLRILTDLRPLPAVPEVDAGALQQAVINLLDNALKFSPPDSEVRVALAPEPSGTSWTLTVSDDGPGIPKEEHTRIFERFYRLGNELRRETTGTGIGLAIVQHIAEGHGGHVRVQSAPGSGSAFTLHFPNVPANLKSEI